MRAASLVRSGWWLCGVLASSGCLPELEDPPLTATGEAPPEWTVSGSGNTSSLGGGSGGTANASTCSSTYSGNIQEPPIDLDPPPCVIQGDVTLYAAPSAKLQALLAQVNRIDGTLSIRGDVVLETALPKLTSVSSLKVYQGGLSKKLSIPKSWTQLGALQVFDTELSAVEGGANLAALGSLSITFNKKLISINLLAKAKTVGSVKIASNAMLKNLTLAPQATSAGAIDIVDNLQLSDIAPMDALSQAPSVLVDNCPMLNNVLFLPALASSGSLTLSRLPGKQVQLPALKQVGALSLNGLTALQALEPIGPLQVSQSVRICVPMVLCALREAWLQKHAPGLSPQTCTQSNVCKS
jgi:hypothetical protein